MIESLALNKDETFLAFGDRNNQVQLWDWKNRKHLKTFTHHTNWVKSVHFSPDGKSFLSAASDFKIRVWNASEQQHEYALKGHTNFVRTAAFTASGKYIISAGNDLTIRFWDIEGINSNELVDIDSTVNSYLYLAKLKKKLEFEEDEINALYSPLKINLAHIYSYLGYDKLLEASLKKGIDIRIDTDGHSPLFYALERRSQGCVDIILKFMIDMKKTDSSKFQNFSYALRNEFEILLDNCSEQLPDFLNAVFYRVEDILNFAVPLAELPQLNYSDDPRVNPYDFVYRFNEIPEGNQEIPIIFKTLPFAISYIKGSSGSIDILDSICNCPNKLILETEMIKTYVRNKWDDLWGFILLLTLLLWGNIVLMMVLISLYYNGYTDTVEYSLTAGAFVIINIMLGLYEIVQAYSQGLTYLADPWNVIDILRLVLSFSWIPTTYFVKENDDYFVYLTFFMIMFNFLRGLTGFRAFDDTRYYTRLILRACFDVIPFLLVFFYSTLAFGTLFYASTPEDASHILEFWKWPYELSMGGFDTGDYSFLKYVCFMIATLINVVVILNLLISILGDTFGSFQAEAPQIDCLEMAEVVAELETLMFWNRTIVDKKYLQKCETLDSQVSTSWEGQLRRINDMIDESHSVIVAKLDEILKKR